MDNRRSAHLTDRRIAKRTLQEQEKQQKIAEELRLEQNEGTFDFDFTMDVIKCEDDKATSADITEDDWVSNPEDLTTSAPHDIDTSSIREEESENLMGSSTALIDVNTDGSNDEQDNNLFEVTATSNAIDEASEASAPMLLFDEEVSVPQSHLIVHLSSQILQPLNK